MIHFFSFHLLKAGNITAHPRSPSAQRSTIPHLIDQKEWWNKLEGCTPSKWVYAQLKSHEAQAIQLGLLHLDATMKTVLGLPQDWNLLVGWSTTVSRSADEGQTDHNESGSCTFNGQPSLDLWWTARWIVERTRKSRYKDSSRSRLLADQAPIIIVIIAVALQAKRVSVKLKTHTLKQPTHYLTVRSAN